jgi:hypothetical protein
VMKGQQALFEYRQFLFRTGAISRILVANIWAQFYVKSTGAISTVIDVELNQYQEYASNRKHIAIQDKSGNWTAHSISNACKPVTHWDSPLHRHSIKLLWIFEWLAI